MPVNIARAWIDHEYRAGLTAGQLASVRANPASAGELSDEELLRISAAGNAPIRAGVTATGIRGRPSKSA